MFNDDLHMELLKGFRNALDRRHHGSLHTKKEINLCKIKLDKLYKIYNKNKDKLTIIDIEWDEKDIESYFREPIWYNAHKRRKRYIKNMEDFQKYLEGI